MEYQNKLYQIIDVFSDTFIYCIDQNMGYRLVSAPFDGDVEEIYDEDARRNA